MTSLTQVLWGHFKMGINNFSNINTPLTSKDWIKKSEKERIETIYEILKDNVIYKDFKIVSASKNGHVVIGIEHLIPVNTRGVLLLDLESILKKKVDLGITVWCETVGDKSKLRQLRGVIINTNDR
jgi:hypothetical protein